MLLYPVAYIVLLVPYSIVRLLDISGFIVSFEAIVFAYVCWFSLGVVDVLLLYNTFRILGPVLHPPSAETEKSLSRCLQNFEYLTPRLSSTSWNEKISQYRNPHFLSSRPGRQGLTKTSSKSSFVLDSSPLNWDQSSTITPPPSASLTFRSDNGRRDRENSSLLAAGIPACQSRFATVLPQSLGIYGGFVPINEHEIGRRHSTQTVERQNPSRSRILSWSKWSTRSSRPYLIPPKTNEGQARLDV